MIEVASDVWIVDGGPVNFYGFPYPTRSVVVRLPNRQLWIWSPVVLHESLRHEVDALGDVAHLVSPNKLHHLFLGDWLEMYPEARLWGPLSTIRKRKDLNFEPPLTDFAPVAWSDQIEQFWLCGSPLLDEIVFFHRPSKTAIFADSCQTLTEGFLHTHWSRWKRTIARLWKITDGFAPLEWRLSWIRRRADRERLHRLLALQPQRVIVAHGDWQSSDGVAFIEKSFRWLL